MTAATNDLLARVRAWPHFRHTNAATASLMDELAAEVERLQARLLYFITELARLEHREALDALAEYDGAVSPAPTES